MTSRDRIARFTQPIEHVAILGVDKRFNPGQPRDPTGRFAGGNFASAGAQAAAEGRMRDATPAEFKAAIGKSKHPDSLSEYSESALAKMRLRLVDGHDAGYAIKNGDELVNLFNADANAKGAGPWLVVDAIEQGARRGDHFDGYLTGFYRNLGFTETRREPNWTAGGPDVIYMQWKGGDPRTARDRYALAGRI